MAAGYAADLPQSVTTMDMTDVQQEAKKRRMDDDAQFNEQCRLLEENLQRLRKRTRYMQLEIEVKRQEKLMRQVERERNEMFAEVENNDVVSLTNTTQGDGDAVSQLMESVKSSVMPNEVPVNSEAASSKCIPVNGDAPVNDEESKANGHVMKVDTVGGRTEWPHQEPKARAGRAYANQTQALQEAKLKAPTSTTQKANGDIKAKLSPAPAVGNKASTTAAPSEVVSLVSSSELNSASDFENSSDTDSDAEGNDSSSTPQSPRSPKIPIQAPRRMSIATPIPPNPEIPLYRAGDVKECMSFIFDMETHFAKHDLYYTDAHKVELGFRYLGDPLKDSWHDYLVKGSHPATWSSYRTFLAYQLRRKVNPLTATRRFQESKQFAKQSITEYGLWLLQWVPHLPLELPDLDILVALSNGAVPSIQEKAKRGPQSFEDYFTYMEYLQDIENTIPERTERLRLSVAPSCRAASDSNSEADSKHHQPPSPVPTRRSQRGSSPERPRSQSRPRLSPAPPEPRLNSFEGKSWWECRNMLSNLEVHFKKFPTYYHTDDRKVACGKRYLSPDLLRKWNAYESRLSKVPWLAFCTFLARQIPCDISPEKAREIYLKANQAPSQSVTTFVLSMLRYAPHFKARGHNRLRHFWSRVLSSIRNKASKTWEDFEDFHDFVAYLQEVEHSMPERG